MKNYVVAIISFFDNNIKQFNIVAENQYDAVKKGMIEFCDQEDYKQSEIDFQNSDDYPKTIEELDSVYDEMDFSVMEVKEFVD